MDRDYPTWMYGPGGESRIFERGDVVPKGWADHPEKVKAPVATRKPKESTDKDNKPGETITEEERVAAIAELRAAGGEVSDDATVEEINAAIDKLTSQES